VALHQVQKWWTAVHLWLQVLAASPDAVLLLPFPLFAVPNVTGFTELFGSTAVPLAAVRLDLLPASATPPLSIRHDREQQLTWRKQNELRTLLENLHTALGTAQIDPARVWLLPRLPSRADHLLRLACMDVLLDTLVVTGMSTVMDALWVGVPVITGSFPTPAWARPSTESNRWTRAMASRTATSLILASRCGEAPARVPAAPPPGASSLYFDAPPPPPPHAPSEHALAGTVAAYQRHRQGLIDSAAVWHSTRGVNDATSPPPPPVDSAPDARALQQHWQHMLDRRLLDHALIAPNPAAFVRQAGVLLQNATSKTAVQKCLFESRATSALFDVPQLVRDLESGLQLAWFRHTSLRLPAEHLLVVPPTV
jgi:hypothetical protein